MADKYILALDQGTTSSRAIIFDHSGQIVAQSNQEFEQIYPKPGWVEHNPEDIWSSQINVARKVLADKNMTAADIAAIGITNQRETTVVWDKNTGRAIHNAIVWQDRRTAGFCDDLKRRGWTDNIRDKTGLVIDAYFSGTKVKWLLDNVEGARDKAARGELLFGNIDTYLMWRLSGGKIHVYRLLERQPHDALQYSRPAVGRGATQRIRHPARHAPAAPAEQPGLRRYRSTIYWAGRSPSRATRATSRPRPSARRASSPAWPRTPTAQAASC